MSNGHTPLITSYDDNSYFRFHPLRRHQYRERIDIPSFRFQSQMAKVDPKTGHLDGTNGYSGGRDCLPQRYSWTRMVLPGDALDIRCVDCFCAGH